MRYTFGRFTASTLAVVPPSPTRNLSTLLARSAQRFPAQPALAVGGSVVYGYGEVARRVAALAGTMRRSGLLPGERVGIVAANCAAYIETMFACWHAGLCAVPVNAKLHADELAYILFHCAARWIFVDASWHAALSSRADELTALERAIELDSAEYRKLFDGAPLVDSSPVADSDPAWLFYTSGTTGRPKGVVLSHGNLLAMSFCFLADVESVAPGDAIVHAAPLSHGSGLYALPHVLATAVQVIPESHGFEPAEILSLLARWDSSCMFAAPTMLKRLVASPAMGNAPLDRLKSIVCGGAPLYVEDCLAANAVLGPRLAQIYGQGESPMTITAMSRALLADAIARGDDARIGSAGVAQTGIEVRIGGADDALLATGDVV